MKIACKKLGNTLNNFILFLDKSPLFFLGFPLIAVLFAPILYLGEGCVFEFHDQLDETLLSYVFSARYPGADVFTQMMNGLPAEGLKPSAVLFVPLYRLFPVWTAFVLQYAIILGTAFFTMYFSVKKIGKSSIIAFLSATLFAMLPFRPVYGLSVVGLPLLLISILSLGEKSRIKKSLGVLGVLYFGLSTNLVLIGYVMLAGIGVSYLVILIGKKKHNATLFISGITLFITYCLTNFDLIRQLLPFFGTKHGSYISHREEYVVYGNPFLKNLKDMLDNGIFHAYSFHKYMWIPVLIGLILIWLSRKDESLKRLRTCFLCFFGSLVSFIFLYAFLAGEWVADLKNQLGGMLKSFQFERFCWALPALWHLLFALALCVIFYKISKKTRLVALAVTIILYLPSLIYVARYSIFYQNINQINNGSATSYMTWESIYAKEVMCEIEDTIGRNMSEYRVASLGISPVVPLMHGFYTIDGYSNNYSLEYKHAFREIIARDIADSPVIASYFDTWGSRCYLFHSDWGTNYRISKKDNLTLSELHFDFDKMKALGCDYLFSAAKITCPEKYNLTFLGSFENEESYWRIWVYELN